MVKDGVAATSKDNSQNMTLDSLKTIKPRIKTNLRKTTKASEQFQSYTMMATSPVSKETFRSIFMRQEPLKEIAKRQATKPIENYLKKPIDERRTLARQRAINNARSIP